MGASLSRFFPWWQVLPVLQRAEGRWRCRGPDRSLQRWSSKCLFGDAPDITVLFLPSTVGVLSKTFSWGALGFDHKPTRPQRCAAPDCALQRGPDARLGGRVPIFEGAFVSSTLHFSLLHELRLVGREWLLHLSDRSLYLAGWILLDLRWLAPREAQAHVSYRQLRGSAG